MQKNILLSLIVLFYVTNLISQTASFSLNKTDATYCLGDTVLFNNTTSGDYVYSYWRFGDAFDTYVKNPRHVYQTTGTYTVWLVIKRLSGDKDSTSKSLNINPSPHISLVNNQSEQFLTALTGISEVQFLWYSGTTLTSETDSVAYYYESGSYSVVAYNQFCSDSANIKITVNSQQIDNTEIIVENNILTPDVEDGANDVLYIKELASYEAAVEIFIYNKWGQLVYKNTNYSNFGGFKGVDDSGKKLDAGTYYYIVKSPGRKGGAGFIDVIR